MKTKLILLVALTGALAAGCHSTRSISDSGFRDESRGRVHHFASRPSKDDGFNYRGELSEFDVLGIYPDAPASEEEIQRTLQAAQRVRVAPGSSVLLIQSGAMFPDGPMAGELGKHFNVVPFSGVPGRVELRPNEYATPAVGGGYARSLRLAAARGGASAIICYWGVLESARQNLETKTISWVPVVGWFVPDERQHMRIKLKVAVIDVASGHWALVSPPPFDDSRINTSPRRGSADQKQVEALKTQAYAAAAKELVRMCGN